MKERTVSELDDLSVMHSFHDDSTKDTFLFIHGIFGNSEETWANTPDVLFTSPSLMEFDRYSFGYKSKVVQFSKPEIFVDQLITWSRAHLGKYNNVYVVAHSMGGLLVRHAIIKLLQNENDHRFAKKFKCCFMIASPIHGAWAAKLLGKIPFLKRLNSRLAYLGRPEIDGMDMSRAYVVAANIYLQSGGSKKDVPRFHYFVGDEDMLVKPFEKELYTEYDRDEGVLHGTHASIKEDVNENSVLIKRILQILQDSTYRSKESQKAKIELVKEATRKRERATQEGNYRLSGRADNNGQSIDVVILSCSAHKSDANEALHPKTESIFDRLNQPDVANLVLEMRSKIVRLVQEGKIDGIEFEEGNRATRQVNQNLELGPDIGGVFNDQKYLQAFCRYTGRNFQASRDEWLSLYERPSHPEFFILSGLYGLIPANDYIQNYDVHLTDVDTSNGVSVQTYWKDRELLTQTLISYLEWIEENKGPVGKVIDLISELSYQEAINWSMVDRRWSVLHRVFENSAGRNSLGNLGIWVQDIIRDPSGLESLEFDVFYDNPRFISDDKIAFEHRIGSSRLTVKREVD